MRLGKQTSFFGHIACPRERLKHTHISEYVDFYILYLVDRPTQIKSF